MLVMLKLQLFPANLFWLVSGAHQFKVLSISLSSNVAFDISRLIHILGSISYFYLFQIKEV